ncbi:zinc finger-like domain-containing protein [Massilia oculi]|uniref:zinc finger-like domain-containing protein n=1 Tax=Massilia oculi TaxID=945844 RepID=UPI001AAECFF1|nr:zinc finger-like domain-containing protein [Massilia oculi]
MTDTDFHARRTELANNFATAGAELLEFMGSAGALAAIPNTAQYVVAGDPAAIRAQLDTVAPQRRMRHGDRPELDLYFGPDAGQARRWAALLTSSGHGVLQEYGTKFEYAQPGQEVLEVMEILPGAANKAAEEGGLPKMPYPFGSIDSYDKDGHLSPCDGFTSDQMSKYAHQAVAADRASRQVANKAEVEKDAARYRWLRDPDTDVALVLDKRTGFVPPDESVPGVGGYSTYEYRAGEELDAAIDAAMGIATPPATTGASTAPTDDEIMSKYKQIVAYPERLTSGDYATAIKLVRHFCKSAPASTVLTEERVEIKDTDAARAYLLQWMVAHFPTDQSFGVYIQTQLAGDFAYQLARALAATPVAAQAGQVAPAQPLAMVSPSELHDIKAGRGGVPVRGNQWRADQTVPIYAAPVAGQVAVPEGFVLMPRRLTAENGAKALLMGEFKESIQVPCPECDGEGDDECLTCENMGEVSRDIPVSWDNIKAIYEMAVEHLAAPSPAKESK